VYFLGYGTRYKILRWKSSPKVCIAITNLRNRDPIVITLVGKFEGGRDRKQDIFIVQQAKESLKTSTRGTEYKLAFDNIIASQRHYTCTKNNNTEILQHRHVLQ
jgi:hypothetical protein